MLSFLPKLYLINIFSCFCFILSKQLSKKTLNWLKNQKWVIRKYLIGPKKNVESLVKITPNDNFLEWYGFYDQEKINQKKAIEQMLNTLNSSKTSDYLNFMINRYKKNNKESCKMIEKLKIDEPDRIYLEGNY